MNESGGPGPLAVVGIASAAALVPLNSTMVAVALPDIARSFDITIASTSSLVTVYLVVMLIGQPLGGRLADKVGDRRLALWSLAGFAVCSVAGALSTAFGFLVAARASQAAFGAALNPSIQSMLRSVSTEDSRGRNFGVLGSVLGVGAASGPLLGGALVAVWGWEATFLVNVAVVAVAAAVIVGMGRRDAEGTTPSRDGARQLVTARSTTLRNPVFVSAFAAQAASTLAQYTLVVSVPFILDARGWSPGAVGLGLAALTIGMVVTGPPGGHLGDLVGRRRPVAAGLGLASITTIALATAGADVASAGLVMALGAFGVGLGFAVPSIMTAAIESVPGDRGGAAAGTLAMSRYVGSIPASILVGRLLDADGGVGRLFWLCAAGALLAVAASAGLGPAQTTSPQRSGDAP